MITLIIFEHSKQQNNTDMRFYIDDELPESPSIEHSAFQTLLVNGKLTTLQVRDIANDSRFAKETRMMAVKVIIDLFECLPMDLEQDIASYIASENMADTYHELSRELNAIANPNDLPY